METAAANQERNFARQLRGSRLPDLGAGLPARTAPTRPEGRTAGQPQVSATRPEPSAPATERQQAQELRAQQQTAKPAAGEIGGQPPTVPGIEAVATARALKMAWLNIIPSWGLSLIYINFHFLMAYFGSIFSRFFPKFGSEWVPRGLQGKVPRSGTIELGEIILLFVLDLIVLTILLIVVSIIGIITWIFIDPGNALWELLKAAGWTIIDTIKNLFKK